MMKVLHSKHSDISIATKHGLKKLGWCTIAFWNEGLQAKKENEEKCNQQREARKLQFRSQGTSHLGSGGRSQFLEVFVSILVWAKKNADADWITQIFVFWTHPCEYFVLYSSSIGALKASNL